MTVVARTLLTSWLITLAFMNYSIWMNEPRAALAGSFECMGMPLPPDCDCACCCGGMWACGFLYDPDEHSDEGEPLDY